MQQNTMNKTLPPQSVYIITGASEGIGNALARALVSHQPKLVLAARNVERLEQLKQSLDLPEQDVVIVKTDVAVQQDCCNLIDTTIKHFGRIDYLVNNAGITMWSEFDQLTDLTVFDKLHQVNLMGSVYCTHYALPHLKQNQGNIVAISSMAGLTGVPTRSAYCASKHAMFGFFDALRVELRASKVNVIMVAPDFVKSLIQSRAFDRNGIPLGKSPLNNDKIMSAEECAQIIINAMAKKKRLTLTSWRGKIGRWLKMIAPEILDNIAAKAIERKY